MSIDLAYCAILLMGSGLINDIKPSSSILSRSLKRPSIIIDYRQLDQLEHPTGCFSTCKADTHQVGSMVLDLIGG